MRQFSKVLLVAIAILTATGSLSAGGDTKSNAGDKNVRTPEPKVKEPCVTVKGFSEKSGKGHGVAITIRY